MKKKDIIPLITLCLLIVTTVSGVLSINLTHAHDFINQYGDKISIYGYGIYAFDSYFKAPILIGTDICMLFVFVPLFIYTYVNNNKKKDSISEMKLISAYTVVLYYAASIAFGVTYNRLFLVYVALFTCSLFGMFMHISSIKWTQTTEVTLGIKIFLVLCGCALCLAWLPDIIPTIISGKSLSLIEVYTTEITYVLDLGIISPLCFVCLYLLNRKNPMGTMILFMILKLCIIIGIMMIPQTICQLAWKIDLPLPVIITKSAFFVILSGFAIYFNYKLNKRMKA